MGFIPFRQSVFRRVLSVIALMIPLMFLTVGCGSGDSSEGGTESIPLTSPKNVSITPKSGALNLVWTKLASVTGVDATYEVWYGTEESLASATMVETNASITGQFVSTNIENLQNDTLYYIRVRAVYEGIGKAAFSNAFTASPIGKPTTPIISASGGWENMLEVVWNASPYATSYSVYWKKGATSNEPPADAEFKIINNNRTLITGVDNNETYRVWVKASNTAGDSSFTYTDTSSAPVTAIPVAPTDGNTSASAKSLVVRFSAVEQASAYKLRCSTENNLAGSEAVASEMSVEADSGTVSFTVPDLINKQTYYIWVQATNSLGASAYSAMGSGTPISRTELNGAIDYANAGFILGSATAEYIWADSPPVSVFLPANFFKRDPIDRLSRIRETAVGNLFCDGAAWYVRDQYPEDPIDFVFLNGGYIEGAIAPGDISVGKILGMIDSDAVSEDTLVIVSLKGSDLMSVFKTAAAVKHSGHGNSGTSGWGITSKEVSYTIRYRTIDPAITTITNTEGDLFRHGWIDFDGTSVGGSGTPEWAFNGEVLDPNKTYRVATTSWLADGHDGYLGFLQGTNRVNHTEFFWQAVAHYIYEMGTVTPYVTHHIKLIGGVPLNAPGWEEGPYYDLANQLDVNWIPPYDNTSLYEGF